MFPPENPIDTGIKSDWITIENKIGTILPDDYKEYIATYGAGYVGQFLWVLNPFSTNGNLMDEMKYFQNSYAELKKNFPKYHPREVYPADNSLLLWGMTDNGDFLYWVYEKNKNPNDWKVGITDMGDEEYVFDMNMSMFLEKLVKCEIQTEAFPENWLTKKNKTFQKA